MFLEYLDLVFFVFIKDKPRGPKMNAQIDVVSRIFVALRSIAIRKILTKSSERISIPEFGISSEISVIAPLSCIPSSELQQLVAKLACLLPSTVLEDLEQRCLKAFGSSVVNSYPGEHYRLLSALVSITEPKNVIEIGTYHGLGSLALLSGDKVCNVETFDVVPWTALQSNVLSFDDFADGRLVQTIADLSKPVIWEDYKARFRQADIIFLDGPKNGLFEKTFLDFLVPHMRGSNCLLVVDDIRTLPMVKLWAGLDLDKLDVTSLAHWAGTGIARL